MGEADGGGEASAAGPVRGEDDVVGVDAVEHAEAGSDLLAALALLPPVEVVLEGFAGYGEGGGVEETGSAEVEDFSNSSSLI